MKDVKIGSATSEPGKLTYGFIDGIELPTGIMEKIPVIIAQGLEEGPTFFLTANVHGFELTGVAVIHELMTDQLAQELKGTVVAIPTLNPSAFRKYHHKAEYDDRDPNRLFPEGKFAEVDRGNDDKEYPKLFEHITNKIYSYFQKYADYHIDFHNHSLLSVPYSILDRLFYQAESEKEESENLLKQQIEMVNSFGMLVCAEFPANKYLKMKLHRSVSGCTFNSLRIPAFTAELGENRFLVPEVVAGSVKGTRNVLKWAGMIKGPIERITEFPVPKPKDRVRRFDHPRVNRSGIVRFIVKPGEYVTKGQPIAKFTDILGRPLGDGYIRTEYDGYMVSLQTKMTVYPNDTIAEMGIKDEYPLTAQLPSKKE